MQVSSLRAWQVRGVTALTGIEYTSLVFGFMSSLYEEPKINWRGACVESTAWPIIHTQGR